MSTPNDEWKSPQALALQDALSSKISIQAAVDLLASLSLSNGSAEDNIYELWSLIISSATSSSSHHSILVDLLVHLSKLQDAKSPDGNPLVLHGQHVWRDLPMFSWQMRDAWNVDVSEEDSAEEKEKKSQEFTNLNAFAASLVATEEPVFADLHWLALVTFREALEMESLEKAKLEVFVLAAAAWVDVVGVEIYSWDEQFPKTTENGPTPGRGGDLWSGSPGFSKERWELWRKRFEDVAKEEKRVREEVREAARDASLSMLDIAAGRVE